MIRTSIATLFYVSSPSAILRGIRSIIVNAFNGMLRRRARSHVGIEVLKRISPTVTYSNSTSSVASICHNVGIVATLLHSSPGIVFKSMATAMCGMGFDGTVTPETAAAFGVSTIQVISLDDKLLSAIAYAIPVSILRMGMTVRDYGKSSKALSSAIFYHAAMITRNLSNVNYIQTVSWMAA